MSSTSNLRTRAAALVLLVMSAHGTARAQERESVFTPHVIACVDAESPLAESWRGAAASRGFALSFFEPGAEPEASARALRELCSKLRRTYRVEGLRFALIGAEGRELQALRGALPYDIGWSLGWGGVVTGTPIVGASHQTSEITESTAPEEVLRVFAERYAQQRPRSAEESSAWLALDRFHDAAARADFEGYFALFAPEGVFLGTDATERWTVPQFRAWAAPHFARSSAWTFLPLRRHVVLDVGGEHAWFDEVLGNETYGLCRGSGVLRLIEGRWKLAQYNLAFLVPNERAKAVVDLLRSPGPPSDPPRAEPTTIYLVRHAEKASAGGSDPELSEAGHARARRLAEMLRSVKLDVLLASQFRRTQQTLAPIAAASGIAVRTMPALDVEALAAELTGPLSGRTTLVSGHSNTIPLLLTALGIEPALEIEDADYSNLLCVVIDSYGARLQRLHF